MIGQREALRLTGCETFDPRGSRIGVVGRVLVDDDTEQPAWITVQTGLFGTNESFVPLAGAAFDGDTLTVAVDRETVRRAPRVALEDGDLEAEQETKLYAHYGMRYGVNTPESVLPFEETPRHSAVTEGGQVRAIRTRLRRWAAAPQ
ncbi:PRC-barrel domain-containing protein [Actinopolyspora sp. H202]|uniref:PRC-barrel domain-containing protein n=1 Tax=Actinopolyspora sp. H202 TaxID=1500456 RepID=UPI003EE66905